MNNTQKMNIETIALLCDTIPDGRAGKDIMNNFLKQVHPYAINYVESRKSWQTKVKVNGKKQAVSRKEYKDLVKYLVDYYRGQEKNTYEKIRQEFMDKLAKKKKPATIQDYRKSHNKYYANDPISKMNLNTLDDEYLTDWIFEHVTSENMDKRKYSKLVKPLKGVCEYAFDKKYITRNPFASIHMRDFPIRPDGITPSEECCYTLEEVKVINRLAREDFDKKPYYAPLAVMFAFQTGLRLGEVVALKWSDIHGHNIYIQRLESKEPEFNEDFTETKNWHNTIRENVTKQNGKPRKIALSDDAMYILELLKQHYEDAGIDSEWLFYGKRYGKAHASALYRRLKIYCNKAGYSVSKFHDIRRTYVSISHDKGMSFARLKEICGHKDERTTIKCYSFDTKEDEENRKILNSLGFLS